MIIDTVLHYLVNRPLISKLILIGIGVLAMFSLLKTERLGFPRVDMGQVNITTLYPGASAADVELNVTVKIEEAIKELEGIKDVISESSENMSQIYIHLDEDAATFEETKRKITNAVNNVNDLPTDLPRRPEIFEVKIDSFPVYEISLAWEQGTENELKKHARALKRRLQQIPSVAKIVLTGERDREFHIQLNLSSMNKKKVSFEEVISAIKKNKIRSSGGALESFITRKGIITLSEFQNPKEIEDIIIRSNYSGKSIKIKDVANVVDTFEKRNERVLFNGHRGIGLYIHKQSKADSINTVDEVKVIIEDYKKNFAPKEMLFISTFDFSTETRIRLDMVLKNTLLGFLLVLATLFIFFDKNTALWTAAGIPVSVALTLIFIPLFGVTINSISLCGLIIVLGMVVDDAIIIAENIYRHQQSSDDKIAAAGLGAKEVVKPILGTILTTVLAFVPIYFIPGTIGKFGLEIPTIVIIMLLASIFEAFFLLPTHLCSKKLKNNPNKKPLGDSFIKYCERKYELLLNFTLNNKFITCTVMFVILISTYYLQKRYTLFEMFPIDQAERIYFSGEVNQNSTLLNTQKESDQIEAIVKKLPKGIIQSTRTIIGRRQFNSAPGCHYCFVTKLVLTPANARDMKALEVKNFVYEEYKKIQGSKIKKLELWIDNGAFPMGKALEVRVTGEDPLKRLEVEKEVVQLLKEYPLTDIYSDYRLGPNQLQLTPNYVKMAKFGINASQVASTVRTAFEGNIVSHLQTPSEKIPFRILLDNTSKKVDKLFDHLYVSNERGRLIPIADVVNIREGKEEVAINHYNFERSTLITAQLKDRKKNSANEIYQKITHKFKALEKKYPGNRIIIQGEAKESYKTMWYVATSFSMAILGIYLVLVIQFNSLTQPMIVITAVPFGLTGIGIIFWLHSMPFSFMCMLGVVGFTGVVVNDSLVMVHFINNICKQNIGDKDLKQKIIHGSILRLRPIMLTTITTVAGLFPSAYAFFGGTDIFISPMVLAMGWGLVFGTIAVLIMIPVIYSINAEYLERSKYA